MERMEPGMNKHNLFTSNFRENGKFFLKLLLLLGAVILFLLHISPQYSGNYQASLIDKVNCLENIDTLPQIVLIGNSNLAFGIDSECIEDTFEMPVVNMGLHGGLGNVFHERMIRFNISEGDIYIICHTDFSDDNEISNKELAWITIEDHFELWKILRAEDYIPMLKAYPTYLKKCLELWIMGTGNEIDEDNVYNRNAFNEYGDIEWEDSGLEYVFKAEDAYVPRISDNVCERLNELNQYLSQRGATLLIAGYPIAKNEFTPNPELYEKFQAELEQKLDIPVISDYTDYIYDEKYFYNAPLHLNNEGKKIRTAQLISDLENYLSGNL